jgi:hypothetical protein
MANTADTLKSGDIVEVTYTGTGDDWNYFDDGGFEEDIGMKVKSIQFHPSGDDDILVINEGGIDGPSILHIKTTATTGLGTSDDRVKYFGDQGTWIKPYIDLSDQTFTDVAAVKIIFELA